MDGLSTMRSLVSSHVYGFFFFLPFRKCSFEKCVIFTLLVLSALNRSFKPSHYEGKSFFFFFFEKNQQIP